MHYSQKKEGKNRSETTRIDTKLVNKQSLEVARVDIEQSLIRLTIPPHFEVPSHESKTVLCPRQHLGVFDALPSRHIRSLRDQVCSRGSSMTWDPRLDTWELSLRMHYQGC